MAIIRSASRWHTLEARVIICTHDTPGFREAAFRYTQSRARDIRFEGPKGIDTPMHMHEFKNRLRTIRKDHAMKFTAGRVTSGKDALQ